jgi:hypothetical protein
MIMMIKSRSALGVGHGILTRIAVLSLLFFCFLCEPCQSANKSGIVSAQARADAAKSAYDQACQVKDAAFSELERADQNYMVHHESSAAIAALKAARAKYDAANSRAADLLKAYNDAMHAVLEQENLYNQQVAREQKAESDRKAVQDKIAADKVAFDAQRKANEARADKARADAEAYRKKNITIGKASDAKTKEEADAQNNRPVLGADEDPSKSDSLLRRKTISTPTLDPNYDANVGTVFPLPPSSSNPQADPTAPSSPDTVPTSRYSNLLAKLADTDSSTGIPSLATPPPPPPSFNDQLETVREQVKQAKEAGDYATLEALKDRNDSLIEDMRVFDAWLTNSSADTLKFKDEEFGRKEHEKLEAMRDRINELRDQALAIDFGEKRVPPIPEIPKPLPPRNWSNLDAIKQACVTDLQDSVKEDTKEAILYYKAILFGSTSHTTKSPDYIRSQNDLRVCGNILFHDPLHAAEKVPKNSK